MINKTEQFIIKANLIHNNKYDYTKVNYISSKTKVDIICPIHNIFQQRPSNHIYNSDGCPKCSNNNKKTTNDFINESNLKHNFKYDYSKVEYKNDSTKINIICKTHGIFTQTPNAHLRGQWCPICSNNTKLTTQQFIDRANLTHNYFYDYSKSIYNGMHKKIIIICPIHSEFEQTASNHIKGSCCPKCKNSKGEKIIENYLIENNLDYLPQHRFNKCKNKKPLPFDFYLPKLNACIEFNGEQHYTPINFFGGIKKFNLLKTNDSIKNNFCIKSGIQLLTIKYDEPNIPDIIDSFIKNITQ